MATNHASRGKSAETKVRIRLKEICINQNQAWDRLPDARAGSLASAICDFMYINSGKFWLIEVKETKHEYRLVHGNFDPAQIARIRMWATAGANTMVLIYHSTLDKWRTENINFFFENREGGSWDLRHLPLLDLQDILKGR